MSEFGPVAAASTNAGQPLAGAKLAQAVLTAALQLLGVGASLIIAFALLVDDSLFVSLWRRQLGLECYTALFAATLASAPLLLLRRTHRAGAALLGAGGIALVSCGAIAASIVWSATGVAAAVLAAANWRRSPTPIVRLLCGVTGWVRARHVAIGVLSAALGAAIAVSRRESAVNADLAIGSSREARAFVERILREARARSLFRDTVTWTVVSDSASRLLRGARSTREASTAAAYVLSRLGDRHSGLAQAPTGEQSARLTAFAKASALPQAHWREDGIGYVEVPWFIDGISDGTRWRAALGQGLRELDTRAPCGWILDLRRNLGGNMWPMLDGLAPLLADGVVGGVAMPQRRRPAPWWIVGARAYSATPVLAGIDRYRASARLRFGAAPVAVLTSRRTASSGEAVAIAFKGRPRTRFFGDTTAGLTTANASSKLSDGTLLALTVGVDIDRTGARYLHAVAPDEFIMSGVAPGDGERLVERAAAWLRAEARCDSGRAVPPHKSRREQNDGAPGVRSRPIREPAGLASRLLRVLRG